jgi:hypothetical protein
MSYLRGGAAALTLGRLIRLNFHCLHIMNFLNLEASIFNIDLNVSVLIKSRTIICIVYYNRQHL